MGIDNLFGVVFVVDIAVSVEPNGCFSSETKHLILEASRCNLRALDLALQITNPNDELKIWVEALCPKWNALQNGVCEFLMLQMFFFFEQQKIPASLAGLLLC